jgi:hypothetical protein
MAWPRFDRPPITRRRGFWTSTAHARFGGAVAARRVVVGGTAAGTDCNGKRDSLIVDCRF